MTADELAAVEASLDNAKMRVDALTAAVAQVTAERDALKAQVDDPNVKAALDRIAAKAADLAAHSS